MRTDRARRAWPRTFSATESASAAPRLEGMEVLFDQKVSLFPVQLEEIRDAAPASRRGTRGRRLA
jgi:hypothetical protein